MRAIWFWLAEPVAFFIVGFTLILIMAVLSWLGEIRRKWRQRKK